MTNAIIRSLFLVLLLTTCAAARTPAPASPVRDVELCELDIHPQKYDGQFVRVHGNINFEFEDFTLYANCTLGKATYPVSIWLTYGGDEPEASTYCCGVHRVTPGNDLEINGHKVGLVRDSEYYKLRSRLESGRLAYPDGTPCYDSAAECKFYTDVQATITGLFTAKGPDSGYGHFGMFHLLAIQQVSDVSANRTALPAGGQFSCDRQTWNTECPTSNKGTCDVDDPLVFEKITAHWNDALDVTRGHASAGRSSNDEIRKWYSNDLLTAYWIETAETTPGTPLKMAATRQKCIHVSAEVRPAPSSATVSCKNFSRSWSEDREAARQWDLAFSEEEKRDNPSWNVPWAIVAETSKKIFPSEITQDRLSETVAWRALKMQLQQWQLTMDTTVQPHGCNEDSAITNVVLSDCQWFSADGMKTYSVNLIKYQSEDAKADINDQPWLVSEVNVRVCKAEP